MGRIKRKGQEGDAVDYMTRTKAVRKLQISLQEFRKLCILKGVFPRDPKNKAAGKDKTYYLTKDIMFLMHDPILGKLREQKSWRKRITKAQGRNAKLQRLKEIEKQKPNYSLAHIVKERYPSFIDALRDLNDALCLMHLFGQLSAEGSIKRNQIETSRRLALEFQSYVVHQRALRKVFLSIKGIYYQAEIMGEKITWIVPYSFVQEMPQFVDVGVLNNFWEFYETLLGFVNYKLYHDQGLNYPPDIDIHKEDNAEGLFALILSPIGSSNDSSEKTKQSTAISKASGKAKNLPQSIGKINNQGDDDDDDEMSEQSDDNNEEAEVFQSDMFKESKELEEFQKLFSNCYFFLSREVPKESLEFVIRCFGGQVSWEGECAPYTGDDERITHYIIDRDIPPKSKYTRAYIQPQWVYDSINNGILLPIEEYGIGCKLPSHLSPFVNDESEGYIPKRAKEIKKLIASAHGEELLDSDNEDSSEDDSDDEIQEERYKEELKAEQSGISYSDAKDIPITKKKVTKQSKRKLAAEEEEQRKQFAKTVIPSRRRRRLYDSIKYSQQKKQEQNETLLSKAKLLEKRAKQMQE